ncbi:MAG: iron donor protein CyaY [Candidatus Binataceae bacterium]
MEQREYLRLTDECLARVARWLEGLDPDEVDYTTGDGVVTIEFADGTRFILSRQAATSQLWLAAGAHASHYNWDGLAQQWMDDKDGHPLPQRLAEAISERLGHSVDFNQV